MYKSINPHLAVHDIYKTKVKVNEHERISWGLFRVSVHTLDVNEER